MRSKARPSSAQRTADGAHPLLHAGNPLTIRSSATEEEKIIAYTFLKMLLSYENLSATVKQGSFNQYSVRNDVLKEQLEWINGEHYKSLYAQGLPIVEPIKESMLNPEQDYQIVMELLEQSIPEKHFPKALENILTEELIEYFEGAISRETLIDRLANRVGLYLAERM